MWNFSNSKDLICVPCIGRRILIHCTTREVWDNCLWKKRLSLTIPKRRGMSHLTGPHGKHQGESGDRRSEESMVQSLCSGFCEMKISPAILTNRRYHSHQGFLPSKCKWGLSKCSQNWSSRYCHYHHLPTTVIPEEFRGMQETRETRKQDWPQIAEVHMKGMDSVSQGACIFPYTEC